MHPVRLASGAAASKSAAARVTGTCNDGATTMVPQPTPAHLGAAGLKQLPLAPDMKRVDLVAPPFSNPTNVAGRAHQAVAWRRPRLPRRPSKRWRRSSATVARMTAAWRAHRAGGVPPRLVAPTSRALKALARAVKARHPGRARNAALDVAKRPSTSSCVTGLPPRSIDARFDLWTRQLRVDATAGNVPAVNGDIATPSSGFATESHAPSTASLSLAWTPTSRSSGRVWPTRISPRPPRPPQLSKGWWQAPHSASPHRGRQTRSATATGAATATCRRTP